MVHCHDSVSNNVASCGELLLLRVIICPDLFGFGDKRLDKKAKLNFKIYDVPDWITCKNHAKNESERLI